MTAFEFASAHPVLTFALTAICLIAVVKLVELPFLAFHRLIRHWNIIARGWPPEHLDADGDFHWGWNENEVEDLESGDEEVMA